VISLTEAAQRKQVSHRAIRKAIERGDLTGVRIGGRNVGVLDGKQFTRWQPDRSMNRRKKPTRRKT